MRQKSYTILAICFVVWAAMIIIFGMANSFTNLQNQDAVITHSYLDREELSLEEKVSRSTHIIDAEYIGTYHDNEWMFRPINVIKGTLAADDETIYVPIVPDSQYDSGKTYLLFLERNISVYYDHDKYAQLGAQTLSTEDENWANDHTSVQQALYRKKNIAPAYYGESFIQSESMDEKIDFADNIFVVKIEEIYVEGTTAPVTVYQCDVLKTILNEPVENGAILIPIFNDTVAIGEEYIVLLNDATKTAPIYTLVAKDSIYSLDSAKEIPELAEMLDNAKDYVIDTVPKSHEDNLCEEQMAISR